jgi:putative hydrolase of the HAD superfamily
VNLVNAPIRAVVFDWGGTLTPWHDIDLVHQWGNYAEVYDPTDIDLARKLADAEIRQWREQQSSAGANGTGTLQHIWQSVGIDVAAPQHALALTEYLRGWDPHTLADPQASHALVALRERGIRIGVLSNTMWPREHHEKVFARDGLLHLIDAAVYSSEISYAKPHADAFASVLQALDVTAAESVFVGDRPWDDVHGAQQVGMRAVLIPHSRLGDQAVDIDVTPDAVIHHLLDIVSVVDQWNQAVSGEVVYGERTRCKGGC